MRYLIRALKYLVYFAIIFFLIVGIVILFLGQKSTGVSFVDLFKEGSLPKIALFFVAVSAIYPKLSFYKKEIYLNGDFTKYAGMIDEVMKSLDYVPETKEAGCVTYIKNGVYARLTRMFEDRVTFETDGNPIHVEGYRKDLLRILSAINFRVRQENRGAEES